MKKYLISGMAAIMFCGTFTSCSRETDFGSQTQQQKIQETYEEAFISRFGNPSPTQDWGFGPQTSLSRARTRTDVTPTVSLIGPTFNATATASINNAASVLDQSAFEFMRKYESYKNSGWSDNFYKIHGTVTESEYSEDYIAQLRNIILNEIQEGQDNRSKVASTGYSVTTKENGKVTLTPIYHNSGSGDIISYYYYPTGTTPNIKTIKKYTIGNICDPQICHVNSDEAHMSFDRKTYTLVYEDANGNCSETFPANYIINFMITNTDLVNGTTDIYDGDAITVSSELTSQGKYQVSGSDYIRSGTEVNAINGKVKIRFGNTLTPNQFAATVQGAEFNVWGKWFKYYYPGNGVNGTLNGGSTCYYLKANQTGYLQVGIHLDGGTLKVYEISDWNSTDYTNVTVSQELYYNNGKDGVCGFPVTQGKVYAVYAQNGKLGYYGYCLFNSGQSQIDEFNALPTNYSWTDNEDPDICGKIYQNKYGYSKIYLKLGKTPVYFNAPKTDESIEDYTALTEGTGINGGLFAGATTYYFKPSEAGVLRIAVALNSGKAFYVKDLGSNADWNATNGNPLNDYNGITVSSKYTGTYDFDVEANHVYAVYAEGSKLGFYGCEFLTSGGGSSSVPSTASKTSIPNEPEFYGDGSMNTEIHQLELNSVQWKSNCIRSDAGTETSHIAVFNINGKNYIGFEDWLDFDYNDVIFEVTNTEGGTTIEEEVDEWDEIRVIAEDLSVGQNTDFDFNDIVFDVRRYKKDTQTKHKNGDVEIVLRAAGGTLPLYLLAYDEDHEVHNLFEVDQYTMVNTKAKQRGLKGKDDADPVFISVTSDQLTALGINSLTDEIGTIAKKIPVWVYKNETQILLDAPDPEVGIASKIGVKITNDGYEWCDEREDIDHRYSLSDGTSLFRDWVQGTIISNDWYTYAKRNIDEYRAAKAAAAAAQGNQQP